MIFKMLNYIMFHFTNHFLRTALCHPQMTFVERSKFKLACSIYLISLTVYLPGNFDSTLHKKYFYHSISVLSCKRNYTLQHFTVHCVSTPINLNMEMAQDNSEVILQLVGCDECKWTTIYMY